MTYDEHQPKIKLPEPVVLPDINDPVVYAALLKKAEQDMKKTRRIRRHYMLRQIFMPWSA
jgi:hypothetical protein